MTTSNAPVPETVTVMVTVAERVGDQTILVELMDDIYEMPLEAIGDASTGDVIKLTLPVLDNGHGPYVQMIDETPSLEQISR